MSLPSWYLVEGLTPTAWFPLDERHADPGDEQPNRDDAWLEEARAELRRALTYCQDLDREILWLRSTGLTQIEVGERVGLLNQCSVSDRENRTLTWLRRVVPVRLAMRRLLGGELVPTHVEAQDSELFTRIFWEHRTQTSVAKLIGVANQTTVQSRWRRLVDRAPVDVREILVGCGRHHDWVRRVGLVTRGAARG